MIIDAKNTLVGRLAGFAAKQALLGETVIIINCEQAAISGKRKQVIANYQQKRQRGVPSKGPFFPRQTHMVVKRIIRGMLPHKQEKGELALKRITCYAGVPAALLGKEALSLGKASVAKLPSANYITIGELAKHL
ncbi:TPA: 50S ribosomal protein L13 [Candidatus Woesearchaeota archaeon]|nr:50S ribosomal protein L13 [Candidatus Woesearchaeota archaeon]HII69149.1 50S ribosomal protein L13 [Candidatus Woesearchaeota archaeon]